MKTILGALLFLATALGSGCESPTNFVGESTTPKGPVGCREQCAAWDMELVGMVSMGDHYTDGCICAVPGREQESMDGAPGALSAISGVEMNRRAREQQKKNSYTPPPSYKTR